MATWQCDKSVRGPAVMYEHVHRRRARRKGLLSCHTLPADLMEYGDSSSSTGAKIPRYAMRPQQLLASDHARLPLLGPAVGPCRDISLSRTLCLVATWHSETTGHRSWSSGAPQLPHWDFFRSHPRLWRPARVPHMVLLAGSLFVTTHEDQFPPPATTAFLFQAPHPSPGLTGRTRGEARTSRGR